MENRKNQFFGFVVILLILGFLNYFRRLGNGLKLSKSKKMVHIGTMITMVIGVMFVLYSSNINNLLSFLIGLSVAHLSEHISNFFILIGDNFNLLISKLLKKFVGIDIDSFVENDNDNNKNKKLEEKDKE